MAEPDSCMAKSEPAKSWAEELRERTGKEAEVEAELTEATSGAAPRAAP
jgi:hypothetical protein